MVVAEVHEVFAETGEAPGIDAVVVGDAGFLVAFAPFGGGLQELVQRAEPAATVTHDGLGYGLELRGGARAVQLVGPGGDVPAGVRHGEAVGELPSAPRGPSVQLVNADLAIAYGVVGRFEAGLVRGQGLPWGRQSGIGRKISAAPS